MLSVRKLCLLATLVLGCGSDGELRVVPPSGSPGGGDRLRIEGSDFAGRGGVVVYVGNRAAKNVVIEGPHLITVMTPQTEDRGPVDVVVRFEDGTEVRLPDAFAFEASTQIQLK